MVNDRNVEELLIQANPVLDPEELRLTASEVDDRCASILERRGAMQTQTPSPERVGSPRRFRKPISAFVIGLFVVIAGFGVVGFLLGGGESIGPADTAPAPTSVPSPAATTAPTPSTSTPAAIPTPTTTPATPSDQIPTMRLDPLPWETRLAVSPDGGFVAVYWSDSSHELKMYRCRDAICTAPETIVLGSVEPVIVEGDERGPFPEDIVFRPDGSPIVLVRGGDAGSDFTLYACDDPDCTSILTAPFGEGIRVRQPRLGVALNGDPRIAYFDLDNAALKLAVCADPVCEIGSRSTSTVQDGIIVRSQLSIRVEPDGRTFFEYDTGETTTRARVAICADDQCSAEPTILTFDDAVMPRTTALDGSRFLVWYRTGPAMLGEGDVVDDAVALEAWALIVTECDPNGCGQAQRIDVGSVVLRYWFGGGRDELRLLRTSDETFLVHSYFSSDVCAVLLEAATVDFEAGTTRNEFGPQVIHELFYSFTASVTDDGEPLLLFRDAAARLRMIDLADGVPPAAAPLPHLCASP